MTTVRFDASLIHNAETVDGLTALERQSYAKIPASIEYMPHPMFETSEAEERLFGDDAPRIEVPMWTHFPDSIEEAGAAPRKRFLLKGDQEVTLFLQFNYAMYRLAKLAASQRRRVSLERARQMVVWHGRAAGIRDALVSANMALVISMAKRSWIHNVDFIELISEGNVALLRSVEKFDVGRGFKFSTYACRAIIKGFARLAGRSGKYYQRFPVEFDPELETADTNAYREEEQWGDSLDQLSSVLKRNKARLTSIERTVVSERYALASRNKGKTLAQVGRKVGLTNERVRQIQILAISKLREAMDDGPIVA